MEDEDEEENIKEAKPLLGKDVQNETLATEEIQGNVNNNTNCRKFGKGQATFYFWDRSVIDEQSYSFCPQIQELSNSFRGISLKGQDQGVEIICAEGYEGDMMGYEKEPQMECLRGMLSGVVAETRHFNTSQSWNKVIED